MLTLENEAAIYVRMVGVLERVRGTGWIVLPDADSGTVRVVSSSGGASWCLDAYQLLTYNLVMTHRLQHLSSVSDADKYLLAAATFLLPAN